MNENINSKGEAEVQDLIEIEQSVKRPRKNLLVAQRTYEQLQYDLARAASVVKLVCGVANNATWLVMMDAHDKIKKHPCYKHQVKRLFKSAFEAFKQNERQLLYADENRMFHIEDLDPGARKKYGNITDAQFFEFWQGLGAKAYTEGGKWVSSLRNKYRLSLIKHNVKHEEELSWVMVAQACLELSVSMYDSAIKTCSNDYAINKNILNRIFHYFRIGDVATLWYKAIRLIEPRTKDYELDEIEERNIEQGIIQLHQSWSDPRMIYGSAFAATQDYSDIFRTKGENKKALREIGELIATADDIMEEK